MTRREGAGGAPAAPGRASGVRWAVAILAAVGAAGCAMFGPDTGVALTVRTRVLPPAEFRTQAVPAAYTAAAVEHVAIKAFKLDGQMEAATAERETDVAKAELSGSFTLAGLSKDSTYRVRAFAYQAAGTADADKISVDGQSHVDVVIGQDAPAAVTVPVRLADRRFDGRATPVVAIAPGELTGAATETVAIATLPPTPVPIAPVAVALPAARWMAKALVTGQKVHVLGGLDTNFNNQTVPVLGTLDASGSLTAAANDTKGKQVHGRQEPGIVRIGDDVYVFGGLPANNAQAKTVEKASLSGDDFGTDFAVATPTLAEAVTGFATHVSSDSVYTLGGYSTSSNNAVKSIQVAPISGGALGSFTKATGTLATERYNPAGVRVGNWYYLLGGSGFAGSQDSIERAPINPDGSLGDFAMVSAKLPGRREGHAAYVSRGFLYVIAGLGNQYLVTGDRVEILPDGGLGEWELGVLTLATARSRFATFETPFGVFFCGGSGNVLLSSIEVAPAR